MNWAAKSFENAAESAFRLQSEMYFKHAQDYSAR